MDCMFKNMAKIVPPYSLLDLQFLCSFGSSPELIRCACVLKVCFGTHMEVIFKSYIKPAVNGPLCSTLAFALHFLVGKASVSTNEQVLTLKIPQQN